MTAIQLNAELYQAMSEIANNETLMTKVLKYVKKLAAQQRTDPTRMTQEAFFAKLDEAERQMERGEYSVMLPGEDLSTHLKRLGYDI